MTRKIRRRSVLKGAGAAAVTFTMPAQAQFLVGAPVSPPPPPPPPGPPPGPPPADFIRVNRGASQAIIQTIQPDASKVVTQIAGGPHVVGPSYAYWIDGGAVDWTLDGSALPDAALLNALITEQLPLQNWDHWHITHEIPVADAAGDIITVIQVDAVGATIVPLTFAQVKALAPQIFLPYAPGSLPFLMGAYPAVGNANSGSSWNLGIPITSAGATTVSYTSIVSWPVSTGSNYGVDWAANSPGVYYTSSADQAVTVTVSGTLLGWAAGNVTVHLPASISGASGNGAIVIVDGTTVFNFLGFSRTGLGTATATFYGRCDAMTDTGWGLGGTSAGMTAVGSSMLAGLLVQAETDQGELNHALQLVTQTSITSAGHTGEAIAGAGGSGSLVQEGQRLAIPYNTAMPGGLSALGQKVFRTLQNYGCFVVDVAAGITKLRANLNGYDSTIMANLATDMGSVLPLLQHVTMAG